MDYENVEYKKGSVIIKGVKNFDIKQITECGQCFRWEKQSENDYIGVAFGKVIEVIQDGQTVTILNTDSKDFEEIWFKYFDFGKDYKKIKESLSTDKTLEESVNFGYGIRILNQDMFEMLISFIISARNNIPSIKKTIKNIAYKFGNKIQYKGEDYYTFPTPNQLKNAELDEIKSTGASFRSKYIIDTIEKVNSKSEEYNLDIIANMDSDCCHNALQNFKGVGAKVADCIMLFSMEKTSAFPVDVWVKRAMIHYYNAEDVSLNKIRIFARDRFGELSGFAQQYLFYYARENKINI